MILTKEEIIKKIESGEIKIEPFDKENVGPASIDLTLGNRLRVFKKEAKPIEIVEGVDYKKVTKIINFDNGYILKPGELVLGITKERIKLSPSLAGWLQSRSRFARVGLMSHITAPFVAPGVFNHQVLEIFNAGQIEIKLLPNTKICQLIVEECKGKAVYKGKFKNQRL